MNANLFLAKSFPFLTFCIKMDWGDEAREEKRRGGEKEIGAVWCIIVGRGRASKSWDFLGWGDLVGVPCTPFGVSSLCFSFFCL